MSRTFAHSRRTSFTLAAIVVLLLATAARTFAATEVTNLTTNTDNGATLNFNLSVRTGVFTTGATSSSWTLQAINAKLSGQPNGADASVQMALYSDGGSQPATLIETLGGNPTPAGLNVYSFTSAGTVLSPNTTYWLVLTKPTGNTEVDWGITSNFSETSPDGWTIGDRFGFSEDGGASWGQNNGFAAQFSVDVVPEPASMLMIASSIGLTMLRRRRK